MIPTTLYEHEDPVRPTAQRDAFAAEMQAAGVDWRLVIYGGALHAFHHPPTRADQTVLASVGYHPVGLENLMQRPDLRSSCVGRS